MWAYYAIASLQIWQSLAMPQQPTLNIRLPGLSPQGGIDLCFLTGTCGRNQGAGPSVSPITYVDGQWFEGDNLKNNLLYLFANDNGAKNWYDAEKYCEANGGYLAEPFTREEGDFLRAQAAQQPKANWWIGLREMEQCNCVSIGRSANQFPAQFDHSKTLSSADEGLVRLTCPPEFQKMCGTVNDHQWRWGLSGSKLNDIGQWRSGEPNDKGHEHCVTLWSRDNNNFKWADWGCDASNDGPNVAFKPLCQRDKLQDGSERNPDDEDYDDEDYYDEYYEGEDEEEETSQNLIVKPVDKCLVENSLISKPIGLKPLDKIKNVQSWAECKKLCEDTDQCSNWSWKGHKRRNKKKKCILFGDIANLEFREKVGGYSGTLLEGCSDKRGDANEDAVVLSNKSFCVEWGALYGTRTSGGKIDTIKERGLSVEDCRQRCLDNPDCGRYSWKEAKKRNNANGRRRNRPKKSKCLLFRGDDDNYVTVPRRKFVSGNILGACKEVSISEADQCHCSNVEKVQDLRNVFDAEDAEAADENVEDFGGLAERFSEDKNQLRCPRKQVKRCDISNTGETEETNQPLVKGAYCVDFDIYYGDGGDEIRYYPEGVADDKACRKLCQDNDRCRFYSYSEKTCSLLGNDDFTPEYDDTAISGTVDGECRNMRPTENYPELGYCECQEVDYSDYEETEEVDLVGLGIIDVRGLGGPLGKICKNGQGKRCYLASRSTAEPVMRSNIVSILRSVVPTNSDAVVFSRNK